MKPRREKTVMAPPPDRDYILGTHDDEIARLGLQHRVWRPKVLDAWRRAGFTVGQTILDVGCGPGHAALDLAEIVGKEGKVVAIDRSRRFLDALESASRVRGFTHIDTRELDLHDSALPADLEQSCDAAWSRWVFAFIKDPQEALARVVRALRPGGVMVLYEYFDYRTWRVAPGVPELDEFVAKVMQCWRADGGEPDIALHLPRWLGELGFEIRSLQPIIEIVPPTNYVWHWLTSFLHIGLKRFVDLGHFTAERAAAITRAVSDAEATPHTYMITPAVLEMIAVRK